MNTLSRQWQPKMSTGIFPLISFKQQPPVQGFDIFLSIFSLFPRLFRYFSIFPPISLFNAPLQFSKSHFPAFAKIKT